MVAGSDDLLEALAHSLLDEERARGEVRAALTRQADLLRQLRARGLPATWVAHRVAASRGASLQVSDRLRLARRLRKRAERETSRRADLVGSHGLTPSPTSSWSWAISPPQQEEAMPKLVKRTVVEEFVEEKDDQEIDEVEEEIDEEAGDDEEPEGTPARRSRK